MRKQADAAGAGIDRLLELARQFEIGLQQHFGAVLRDSGEAAQAMQLPLGALMRVALRLVAQDGRGRRMKDDRAFAAVDDDLIAGLDLLQQPS